MKMEDAFPSKFLAKGDLDQKNDTIVTVTGGSYEEVGQDKERLPCIWLKEFDKGLIVNKTNMGRMFNAHKVTDTDELKGKQLALYVDHEVSFQGKTVSAIRVRATAPDDEAPF